MRRLAVLLVLVCPVAAQGDKPVLGFVDPAPPRVLALPAADSPEPRPYKGLRFFAAPKPLAAAAVTEDSLGFLGSRRNGVSCETHLLGTWPESGPKLVWTMRCGEGFASPAVKGDHLVYPHRLEDRTIVDCLHAETGQRFWRFEYPMEYRGDYVDNSGPPSTPQIDGDRVYFHGVAGMLHCLDLTTGRVVWKRNLKAEFRVPNGFFGVVTSPLVTGDLLVVNLGAPGGPSIAAFDKRTGKLVWGAGRKWGMCCASPIVATVHGRPRLFALAGGESRPAIGGLMVMDPKTGELDFEFPFRSRTFTSVVGATPVIGGSRVFLTAAYNTGTAALDLRADGEFEKVWATKRIGIEFATPLYVDGHLYAVVGAHDRAGAIVCLDPDTGKELARTDLSWEETVPFQGKQRRLSFSIGTGTLLHVDGGFFCLGDNGHLLRLACTPKGATVRARGSLFRANQSWTPLVISRGLLYACQNNPERFGDKPPRLLCFDLRGE